MQLCDANIREEFYLLRGDLLIQAKAWNLSLLDGQNREAEGVPGKIAAG